MSLINEEVDKQCNTFLTVFIQLIDLKDPVKLLEFFHPHAVLIHVGQSAKYGREELLEVMKEWVNMDAKIEAHPSKRLEAGHGDYLFDFGTMEFKFTDGNIWKCKYEFIYKREDGKYFLYRDQIEPIDETENVK
uniref:SnoaL-like domain-containing protein n=1 Tax=Acrobeloides nanus TaxID=290746 RepID=A0A914E9U5_9BILA